MVPFKNSAVYQGESYTSLKDFFFAWQFYTEVMQGSTKQSVKQNIDFNSRLWLSLKYNKRIKPLKRPKLFRVILNSPNLLLQFEEKACSCQKPVACT